VVSCGGSGCLPNHAGDQQDAPAQVLKCWQSGFFLPRFALFGEAPCILRTMPHKPTELPPRVAKAFVRDMRAFFKAKNQLEQDEIASHHLHALWAFQKPRDKKLRLAGVKEMFLQMRAPFRQYNGGAANYRREAVISADEGSRITVGRARLRPT
jgi:hypothetical protein